MDSQTLILVGFMILAGAIGGWMNYLMAGKDDQNRSITKSLVLGVGASLMVPLLLNMISSNLMELARGSNGAHGDPLKLLVLVGICLVAAVFSARFIQTIGDRVLQEVQDAKKRTAEVKEEVAPLISKFTEPSSLPRASDSGRTQLEEHDRAILKVLADPRYAYRFTTGVRKDTGLLYDEVEKRLTDLTKRGLAGRTVREKDGQVLWYLTADGQRALSSPEAEPKQP